MRIGLGGEHGRSATESSLRSRGCSPEVLCFLGPRELVEALAEGDVDAAVRGSLSSSAVLSEMKRVFRLDEVMRAAVLEDHTGRPFILAPVGIDEGSEFSSRLAIARATAAYFSPLGRDLSFGVLSKGRLEDAQRGEEIRLSLEEGEELTMRLREDGLRAEHRTILIEEAVRSDDIVIAPDGISGNLMFRTLHFVGGRKAFGAPVVNLPRVFVDTSRGRSDFSEPVLLAAGLASRRAAQPGRP